MREPVTITLATIPERIESLYEAVCSLRPQCDHLAVYLNGYGGEVPAWLDGFGVIPFCDTCEAGDLGDAGKFYRIPGTGYHLTVDDDLFYPADYVARLLEAIEAYDRKHVVTFHGSRVSPPLRSYYRDRTDRVYCLHELAEDRAVHIPGTGVMGYHTSAVRVSIEDFPRVNMADIWFALACQKQHVGIIAAAHPEGWIRHQPIDQARTIWGREHEADGYQTHVINSHTPWKTYARPRSLTTSA